ncbi:hypothetical protein E2C01_002218 [Portunus trituberculatus]|uniref:Uncharacterized protein n=1 Tax=Portunus trituberculatus TaxID=210409 RepID=A0A5B7CQ49_PORTR|nr:hypothetical protein [Portunus trituberculatus]
MNMKTCPGTRGVNADPGLLLIIVKKLTSSIMEHIFTLSYGYD